MHPGTYLKRIHSIPRPLVQGALLAAAVTGYVVMWVLRELDYLAGEIRR